MMESLQGLPASAPLPRVTIKFCTQCKWMLRAAYFAQELLSTFSTDLGEVALQPSSGGVFKVEIFHLTTPSSTSQDGKSTVVDATVKSQILWDRKADGGFPETKELKRRVRDIIDPNRDLGHVDDKKKLPTIELGDATACKIASRDHAATGRHVNVSGGSTISGVHSTGRGGAEEEVLEHEELSLEAQPGGRRYREAVKERRSAEEEIGAEGVVCNTVRDEKRDPDGTICDDCS